ncbi:MAG: hypothetical protein UX89_C0001G0070 [Parcubacteria group bacterium GW2011_GWA2_47_16]|nr:MAG: hypothetical protein UX89_C0001G0070 [Parcubacteria group bacterium GW2011_GWA2_47_16]
MWKALTIGAGRYTLKFQRSLICGTYTVYAYVRIGLQNKQNQVSMIIINSYSQPTGPLPKTLTLNPLQELSVRTFREGNQRLTEDEAEQFLVGFSTPMGRVQAWNIVKDYALGKFDDVGEEFLHLIQAWLVLGDAEFTLLFRVVRLIKAALDKGLERLDELVTELKRIFPRFSRRKLEAEIQAIREVVAPSFAEV